ncbi:MAG: hypothetical protein JAZ20_14615 [Candidatus Thiodiazotropha weberae]|nr:hypothetical protein [Candidatus Thiodiazotropha lotti]MCG8010164.1 hypothetical protein [Candidatus Thiodiazotropha lotti]MCG8021639.1 hypothetical protein [Candidatus Thiodiazotropha lotti]MCW4208808.1 hypothetical protein [Candidatus Thiodiazotropha lotti]MCW4209622.1 hypothetical protein [Candidatus Thiodiazotropha lotti]
MRDLIAHSSADHQARHVLVSPIPIVQSQASVTVYSLLKTAKAIDIETYDFLLQFLQHIASTETVAKHEALLLWNMKSVSKQKGRFFGTYTGTTVSVLLTEYVQDHPITLEHLLDQDPVRELKASRVSPVGARAELRSQLAAIKFLS